MSHVLVVPEELMTKLRAAHSDPDTHNKWLAIGVDTVDDMLNYIINRLNNKYAKLKIQRSIRVENKTVIKERINNSSRVSFFAGYLENEKKNVDGLFFYVDPDAGNANDFLSSKIPPVIIGIYNNIANVTNDLHINNMPIFAISLCTTSRVNNASVKRQIICAQTMGINYLDIFDNRLYDVINSGDDDIITSINTIQQLNELILQDGSNDYFSLDVTAGEISIICSNMLGRTNDTAYIYRWFLRVIPAVYLAAKEKYVINTTSLNGLNDGDIPTIRDYILKI